MIYMPKQNPIVYESKGEGFYVQYNHPRLADFIWIGTRFHSNFGGGVGFSKMRDPKFYVSRAEAEQDVKQTVIPFMQTEKPSWDITGW